VSGRPFRDFVRDEVFVPLGMSHASVGRPESGWLATHYGSDRIAFPAFTTDNLAAQDMFASLHDLVRFAMLHMRRLLPGQVPILSAAAIDEMQRTVDPGGIALKYGVGWYLAEPAGTVRHGGSHRGTRGGLVMIPSEMSSSSRCAARGTSSLGGCRTTWLHSCRLVSTGPGAPTRRAIHQSRVWLRRSS
jgi:CubicO group peptidase (beta-lactamase class C family)